MTFGANNLQPKNGAFKRSKRVGRGNASQKGTTAGRGMKGQTARSGSSGTALIGLRQSILKVKKLRGFKSLYPKKETVTLSTLDRVGNDGDIIDPYVLKERGAIKTADSGVKIVDTGSLSKKLTVSGCHASEGARKAIEAAGGSFAA